MTFPSHYLCLTKQKSLKVMETYNSLNEYACALTCRMSGEARNLRLKANNLLQSKSMHIVPHILIDLQFVGVIKRLKMYRCFTFERQLRLCPGSAVL